MNFDIVKSNGNRFFFVSHCFVGSGCWFFRFRFSSIFIVASLSAHIECVRPHSDGRNREMALTTTTALLMENGNAFEPLQSGSVWWTFLLENFESFSPLAKTIPFTTILVSSVIVWTFVCVRDASKYPFNSTRNYTENTFSLHCHQWEWQRKSERERYYIQN